MPCLDAIRSIWDAEFESTSTIAPQIREAILHMTSITDKSRRQKTQVSSLTASNANGFGSYTSGQRAFLSVAVFWRCHNISA